MGRQFKEGSRNTWIRRDYQGDLFHAIGAIVFTFSSTCVESTTNTTTNTLLKFLPTGTVACGGLREALAHDLFGKLLTGMDDDLF